MCLKWVKVYCLWQCSSRPIGVYLLENTCSVAEQFQKVYAGVHVLEACDIFYDCGFTSEQQPEVVDNSCSKCVDQTGACEVRGVGGEHPALRVKFRSFFPLTRYLTLH